MTFEARTEFEAVRACIESAGGMLLPQQHPTPLGQGEAVIEVEGPADFALRMKGQAAVKAIYPSSSMQSF